MTNLTNKTNLNSYTVVLSSVESSEDTVTHIIYNETKEAAISMAFDKSDHWYTDVVSVSELPHTNLTIENNTMNIINSINMDDINKSALISSMAGELYHNDLNERVAYVVATAYVCAAEYMVDGMETFMEALVDGLEVTSLEVVDCEHQPEDELDGEAIMAALVKARFLTEDDEFGPRWGELLEQRQEAYLPTTGEIERRFNYVPEKGQGSALLREAIHALESTPYTVDSRMLSIAKQVQAKLGTEDADGYVIAGCEKMKSELEYFSEFKSDRRGRLYQAACHGPNGQAGDRSRALMDLAGVPTDYNVEEVKQAIRDEMMDMVAVDRSAVGKLIIKASKNPVDFIIEQLELDKTNEALVKKPWSFTKAAFIWIALAKNERPYIGMAVGLDAKCSGPQLGAMMTGDQKIAAACGMTLTELEDAYHIAIEFCAKAGFTGISRSGIKKAYMGIFYGQGWAAYTDVAQMTEDGQTEILAALRHGVSIPEENAKAFHQAISASFGAKMANVRSMVKGMGADSEGRTQHYMPDGFLVSMNYKHKVNALGERIEWDTNCPDVRITNNAEAFKFIKFAVKTKDVHVGDFARNGFVNMIQATDALIARLIIVHLARLGAKHIISVHDCFRVNVTEMHLLRQAIKNAYQDLFGSEQNIATADMPKGMDILGMYFEGANKQLVEGTPIKMVSQFFQSGSRRMKKINGVSVPALIDALGKTYYFDK